MEWNFTFCFCSQAETRNNLNINAARTTKSTKKDVHNEYHLGLHTRYHIMTGISSKLVKLTKIIAKKTDVGDDLAMLLGKDQSICHLNVIREDTKTYNYFVKNNLFPVFCYNYDDFVLFWTEKLKKVVSTKNKSKIYKSRSSVNTNVMLHES